jgi:hypothetical protein
VVSGMFESVGKRGDCFSEHIGNNDFNFAAFVNGIMYCCFAVKRVGIVIEGRYSEVLVFGYIVETRINFRKIDILFAVKGV